MMRRHGLLTAAERSAMQQTATENLPDRATIRRASRISDGLGTVETWQPVQRHVPCRVGPATPAGSSFFGTAEASADGRSQIGYSWPVTVPYDTDVTALDRIDVQTDGPERSFDVGAVSARHERTLVLVLQCTERPGQG